MDQTRLDAALQRLSEERAILNRLRSDYAVVARSRFFALREFWTVIKDFLRIRRRPIAAITAASDLPATSAHAQLAKPENAQLVATWNARAAAKPLSLNPLVSVIIPAYNHTSATIACLQSIADTWFETLPVQIILVDDASDDETSTVVGLLDGLDLVRNGANQGFLRSCNRAAAIARGKFLCFLNNDTTVCNAWLDELVSLAEADPSVGAVGSKLVYPNGKLQEAGAIVFRDGNGWNYGRGENAEDPRYNFVREVDYCSGAALLVRSSAFRQLGGFDDSFAPAYYEDADLCFGLRSIGYRVLYQPRSVVMHTEGVSSGTDITEGVKRFQEVNKKKFVQKWEAVLPAQARGEREVTSAARRRRGRTILVIDSYVPLYDKEAGSDRLLKILRILIGAGYYVFFLPDNYAPLQPYTRELQAMGIEVLHHIPEGRSAADAVDEILPLLDFAWICRPELFEKYSKVIRRNRATKVLYDTIDLHFVRKQREAELLGNADAGAWQEIERVEIGAALSADATITVSNPDRDVLRARGIENVFVVPTIHVPRDHDGKSFAERSGVLFIGGYNHAPNVDAVEWLCREIMPIVWKKLPGVKVTLLGSNPPASVKELESVNVSVPGYLPDVSSYFEQSRVFVAPIRFGAGLKGKIGHSLEYRLPVVTTRIGAEGFPLRDAVNCLIADTAQTFAAAVARVYANEADWSAFSDASHTVLENFSPTYASERIREMLEA